MRPACLFAAALLAAAPATGQDDKTAKAPTVILSTSPDGKDGVTGNLSLLPNTGTTWYAYLTVAKAEKQERSFTVEVIERIRGKETPLLAAVEVKLPPDAASVPIPFPPPAAVAPPAAAAAAPPAGRRVADASQLVMRVREKSQQPTEKPFDTAFDAKIEPVPPGEVAAARLTDKLLTVQVDAPPAGGKLTLDVRDSLGLRVPPAAGKPAAPEAVVPAAAGDKRSRCP